MTMIEIAPAFQPALMVSTRQAPWMKLGALVDKPSMTAAEAAQLGGLDFDVEKCDLFYAAELVNTETDQPQHVVRPIPNRKAIVRKDTGVCLGIMAKNYPLLQYREAFDFMDQVNPHFVAAGQLRDGRQGFMVVQTDLLDNVLGNEDPHTLFGVLRTSHDGTRAVEVTAMALRGKCMNQLTMNTFTRGARYRWGIKHTSTMAAKLKEATSTLSRLGAYADAYRVNVDRLVHTQLHEMDARLMLNRALPKRPKTQDQIDIIMNTWMAAPTVGYPGTGWGLVNAVSEYFDHLRKGGSAESRFIGALQGVTHNMINKVTQQMLTPAS